MPTQAPEYSQAETHTLKEEHIKDINQSKKDGKDQEMIQSSTTPDPGYHMGKKQNTINITNKGQEVSPFPAGDHKAAMNRRESIRNTRYKNTKAQK